MLEPSEAGVWNRGQETSMLEIELGRPDASEHIPYFGQYIALVPNGNIIGILTKQVSGTAGFFGSFTAGEARQRPAPGEWNPIEIAGHLVDTERVLAYRLLRIARADPVLWESIEFESYVEHGGFAERDLAEIMDEFVAVRASTVALLRGLGVAARERRAPDEWSCRSVRALAYVIAGHELHHVADLEG
jgi:hypothetical protein